MTFKDALNQASENRKRFEKIEGKPWKAEGAMIELVKQIGELSKLIMAYEGYYFRDIAKDNPKYDSSREKIGNELADIVYAAIRIADYYEIDLEKAFIEARQDEDECLKSKGV